MNPAAQAAEAGAMVVMGRIAGAWGVKGWVKVAPYSADPAALADHATWWVSRNDAPWEPCDVIASRPHGATVIGQLAGVATPEDAQRLRGALVGLPRAALPAAADDEVYLADLPGLAVVNRQGVALGTVESVQETGAHPVLRVVEAGGRTRLIPFVAAYVDSVDLAERTLAVDWGEDY
ncbi:MAG: 16S rRNA processing protein RimM [Proteobacteria bacterium]|nr:16S rRNA processing protein RimM [Pseudomonadota bacterium]